MKRIGIVLAAGFGSLFVASPATAQEPAVAPPPTPVVTAGPTMEVVTMSSAPARRGLFPRLRNRRAMMTTMPVVTTGSMSTPMPMPVPSGAVAPTPVVPAAGIAMEEGTGVVMAEYSEVQPVRRGLLARLRMRR